MAVKGDSSEVEQYGLRIAVDEVPQALGHTVGNARDGRTPEAVTDEHQVAQVFVPEHLRDVVGEQAQGWVQWVRSPRPVWVGV